MNPLAKEQSRTWVSEASESKFGQLPAGDLSSFTDAVNVLVAAGSGGHRTDAGVFRGS